MYIVYSYVCIPLSLRYRYRAKIKRSVLLQSNSCNKTKTICRITLYMMKYIKYNDNITKYFQLQLFDDLIRLYILDIYCILLKTIQLKAGMMIVKCKFIFNV